MKNKKLLTVLSSTAIFLSLHTVTPTVSANSQKLNGLQQQQEELQNKSNQLQGNIQQAEQEMNSLEAEREQLKSDIAQIQSNIDKVIGEITVQEEEIARLEEEINQLNKEIEELEDKIEKRNIALAKQARGVQTSGSATNIIDIVLSAQSLTELLGKMEVISTLVRNNNTVMEEQIQDKELVEATKVQVAETKEAANQVKLELEVSRNNLLAQRLELDAKVELVMEQFDLTTAQRDALKDEQAQVAAKTNQIAKEMEAERERIAAEEARKAAEAKRIAEEQAKQRAAAEAAKQQAAAQAAKPAPKQPVQTATASTSTAPSTDAGWIRPASGYVSSPFGYRMDPISGQPTVFHNGMDIAGSGPIRATRSGVVRTASFDPISGYFVVIDHGGGMSSLYAHMTPGLMVAPGQSVSQGQQIGTMGTTGYSTGVHLHFEIRQGNTRLNPASYVGG